MKVAVENLDRVRKNVEVIPDADKVEQLREEIFSDLKKQAKIKGFRPGKVPRSVVQNLYKDHIEDELRRKVVETTMIEALKESKVEPITEPQIDFLDGENQYGYKMECEIEPEFEIPEYQGIDVTAEKIVVTDEEIAARLESLQQMHAQMVNRESDAPAQKGDFVLLKYEGFLNGKPVKEVKSDAYPVDLGSSSLMPEFENAVIGMKAGEEKEFELTFPADYPSKEVASKTLLFKVLAKEVKEKKLPELNDEFAKDLSFENMDLLKAEAKKELEKEKETQGRVQIVEQIVQTLVGKSDIPIPPRFLQKKVESMIQDAKSRMKASPLNAEQERYFDAALQKEYEPEAEKRIKMGLILAKIADKEGLKVEDSEVEDRLKKIAEDTKRAYDYIRNFYDKYNLMDSLKSSMLDEKGIDFLIEKAAVKEKE